MGASLDWSRERFTMDEGLSRGGARKSSCACYEEGLIYRGKRLVNWDPVLHTAVSDLEVVSEEEQGSLWHIRYPLADGTATIWWSPPPAPKPCSATPPSPCIPDDERYRHLIGKHVELPLTGRDIPIIADDYVDPEFGTGCVKITPAHDFNDYEVGKRHRLPLINIFTHGREDRPAAVRPITASTASRRASASSPIWKPPGCSRRSSRTSSWCRAATAPAP